MDAKTMELNGEFSHLIKQQKDLEEKKEKKKKEKENEEKK